MAGLHLAGSPTELRPSLNHWPCPTYQILNVILNNVVRRTQMNEEMISIVLPLVWSTLYKDYVQHFLGPQVTTLLSI